MEQLPPFLSSESMEGDPPCHWADFLMPQLRRCPYNFEAITWQDYLGNGAEGCVSTIKFGDLGPLALKVVGISPLRPASATHYPFDCTH
jgi:hypothetical protein